MKISRPISVVLLKLLLTVSLLAIFPSTGKAQEQRVVFPDRVTTISDAFAEIEKQTDFLISYDKSGFNLSRKVRLSHNNLTVKSSLDQLLIRTRRTYIIKGNHILIIPAEADTETVENPSAVKVAAENKPQAANIPQVAPEPEPVKIEAEKRNVPRPPVDLDSLEQALLARKIEYPVEIPNEPILHSDLYYRQRDRGGFTPGRPDYMNSLPIVAIRTNLLYDFAALTLNLGLEIGVWPRGSVLLTGSYNGWGSQSKDEEPEKLNHWLLSAEYRYWFCERFNGHFMGAHIYYGYYNISGKKIPIILEKGSEDYRYKGSVVGAGVSYGYQLMLGKKWNLEFNAGVGFGRMYYDKSDCWRCSDVMEKDVKRNFVAPTKLGVSLVYIIK